jgi:hypothetical protein
MPGDVEVRRVLLFLALCANLMRRPVCSLFAILLPLIAGIV